MGAGYAGWGRYDEFRCRSWSLGHVCGLRRSGRVESGCLVWVAVWDGAWGGIGL